MSNLTQHEKINALVMHYKTMSALATALGVNKSQLSRWLSKKTRPRLYQANKINNLYYENINPEGQIKMEL